MISSRVPTENGHLPDLGYDVCEICPCKVSVAFVRGRVSFGCCQPVPLIIMSTIIVSSISIIIIIMVIDDQMFKNGGKSFASKITIAMVRHACNKTRQFYQFMIINQELKGTSESSEALLHLSMYAV